MRLVLLAIQMLVLVLPTIAEDPLSRFVDPASVEKLRAGGSVRASVAVDALPALTPAISSRGDIASEVGALHPSVAVEMLKLIPGNGEAMDSPARWLKIYNALHSVSTMKGITYYSVTRGKDQVLFTQSYAVSSTKDPKRIDDPVFETIPPDDVLLTFQEDNSFGKNSYQETFHFRTDHMVVKIENLTTMSFLFVPLVSPRNLVSQVVLVPVGPDLLYYGLAYSKSLVPVGDRRSREDSLANRLTAVEAWLKSRLAAAGTP
jgi:hypothetical protein